MDRMTLAKENLYFVAERIDKAIREWDLVGNIYVEVNDYTHRNVKLKVGCEFFSFGNDFRGLLYVGEYFAGRFAGMNLGDSVIFDDGRLIFENSIGTTFVIY